MGLFRTKTSAGSTEKSNRLSVIFRSKPATPAISENIPHGERPRVRGKGEKIKPEEMRNLRELIRQRYAVDLEIWNMRKVRNRDRPKVEEMMVRADALLAQIRATVNSMDDREYFANDEEYKKFKQIKTRIMSEGKRTWENNPPWNDG